MKITRSALKNLIKEEMNRINEDEGDAPAYLPMDENPSSEAPKPLWIGQLSTPPAEQFKLPASEVGMARLGANFSVRWPADSWKDDKVTKLTSVTMIQPAPSDASGAMSTGDTMTIKIYGRSEHSRAALMALQGNALWQVYGRDIEAAGDAWYDISQGRAARVGGNNTVGAGFVKVDQAKLATTGDEDDE